MPDEDIRLELDKNILDYKICIPDKSCKEEYYNRFISRGNTKEFIDFRINRFESRIEELMNQNHPLIGLKKKNTYKIT